MESIVRFYVVWLQVLVIFGRFSCILGGGQRFVSVIFGDFKMQNSSTRGESGALPPGGPALSGRPACIHFKKNREVGARPIFWGHFLVYFCENY